MYGISVNDNLFLINDNCYMKKNRNFERDKAYFMCKYNKI